MNNLDFELRFSNYHESPSFEIPEQKIDRVTISHTKEYHALLREEFQMKPNYQWEIPLTEDNYIEGIFTPFRYSSQPIDFKNCTFCCYSGNEIVYSFSVYSRNRTPVREERNQENNHRQNDNHDEEEDLGRRQNDNDEKKLSSFWEDTDKMLIYVVGWEQNFVFSKGELFKNYLTINTNKPSDEEKIFNLLLQINSMKDFRKFEQLLRLLPTFTDEILPAKSLQFLLDTGLYINNELPRNKLLKHKDLPLYKIQSKGFDNDLKIEYQNGEIILSIYFWDEGLRDMYTIAMVSDIKINVPVDFEYELSESFYSLLTFPVENKIEKKERELILFPRSYCIANRNFTLKLKCKKMTFKQLKDIHLSCIHIKKNFMLIAFLQDLYLRLEQKDKNDFSHLHNHWN